jgi:hypothetical protein
LKSAAHTIVEAIASRLGEPKPESVTNSGTGKLDQDTRTQEKRYQERDAKPEKWK